MQFGRDPLPRFHFQDHLCFRFTPEERKEGERQAGRQEGPIAKLFWSPLCCSREQYTHPGAGVGGALLSKSIPDDELQLGRRLKGTSADGDGATFASFSFSFTLLFKVPGLIYRPTPTPLYCVSLSAPYSPRRTSRRSLLPSIDRRVLNLMVVQTAAGAEEEEGRKARLPIALSDSIPVGHGKSMRRRWPAPPSPSCGLATLAY